MFRAGPWGLLVLVCGAPPLLAAPPKGEFFLYDPADETVHATVLENPNDYEASLLPTDGGLWLAWLEFVSGKGDRLWIGRRDGEQAFSRDPKGSASQPAVSETPGRLANATLTPGDDGHQWLTYEAEADGQWDVLVREGRGDGRFGPACAVSTGSGPDINHRAAPDGHGGIWVVWQGARDARFVIYARHLAPPGLGDAGAQSEAYVVSDIQPPATAAADHRGDAMAGSQWHPAIAVAPDGTVYVVWDAYDGTSYNVYARACRGGSWTPIAPLACTTAFEGRASIAAGHDGRVWALWEEGEENWGAVYRARRGHNDPTDTRITDERGPLHRFRQLRLALLECADGGLVARPLAQQLPMPSREQAIHRADAPAGVRATGSFYERGRLAVDRQGRPWVAYRQYYTPWLGVEVHHHVESGWGVYARCLTAGGWSKLYRFDVNQGDGLQRLEIAPQGDGIAALYTTGRTDRNKNDRPRGLVLAFCTTFGGPPGTVPTTTAVSSPLAQPTPAAPPPLATSPRLRRSAVPEPTVEIAGKTLAPFFGDLHRHTDLSLCFVPTDGTIDDAYRYAIDVAGLNFLGITDHTHDLVMGDPLCQLWWRSVKEVTRHELPPRFLPIYAYERSRSDTDHNVFSLRPDMLRPHTFPLPNFWKQLDGDTFTIAHQPVNPRTWATQDNAHRPLFEIYQGFRDRSIEKDAHAGLDRGYLLGFIAASDHLSTSASYAGVWAESPTREGIFRALQARRTFGATDQIRLLLRAGEHCMGEKFAAPAFPLLQIDADATGSVAGVDIVLDGQVHTTLSAEGTHLALIYIPPEVGPGLHYLYVHLRQADGNQAWSSPIWVNVGQ